MLVLSLPSSTTQQRHDPSPPSYLLIWAYCQATTPLPGTESWPPLWALHLCCPDVKHFVFLAAQHKKNSLCFSVLLKFKPPVERLWWKSPRYEMAVWFHVSWQVPTTCIMWCLVSKAVVKTPLQWGRTQANVQRSKLVPDEIRQSGPARLSRKRNTTISFESHSPACFPTIPTLRASDWLNAPDPG